MSNHNFRRQYSQISRKILTQYILSVLGFIAGIFICYFLAWFICSQFIWGEYNLLYYILKVLQSFSPIFIVGIILLGVIVLTRYFLSKPLGYLDEVIDAAEKLSQPNGEPIKLSEAMRDVQNELNLVQEKAIRNAAAAKEAEQRKNDLIVYLAHDLKTPLTSVIGYLTLLRDEPQISQELRTRYTGVALNKAERLEELVNEFFDITRFNLTSLTLEPEYVNLSRMLEQITNEFNPILAEKNLQWQKEIAPEVEIFCDPDKLERVFDNLIRNAVNYSYVENKIFLSMRRMGNKVEIVVKNRGKTIPPDKLERIFEQFFRLDSSRSSATGGAGLGLAISKELVELHNGTIKVDSANESISFTVLLSIDCKKIVRTS